MAWRYNEVMAMRLEAVFEEGVLRPLEPLALQEHQRVQLTIEGQSVSRKTPVGRQRVPVNERREEFRWLAEKSAAYAGKWVALDGNRLVAVGDDLPTVRAASRAAGVERPLVTHLPPEGELPFGGW